ncbi:MAG: APC family permease [Gemmatimonadaceae bacterium]|nr:APC family permease [Gemmatimonadaceae bacterium]
MADAVVGRGRGRALAVVPLAFVMFFNVSGGAFTTEGLVAGVGPGIALLALLLVPLLWALPESLLIAELAARVPEEGGYYRWVDRAFGRFWAFQNAWCTLCYSIVEMAIYPALFNQYLAWFVPGLPPLARWGVALCIIWSATAINLRGAYPVGRVSVAIGSFVLAGFGVLALVALFQPLHSPLEPWRAPHAAGAGLSVALSTALWNYIGWDNASTALGEIEGQGRAYGKALAIALPMTTLGYLVPVGAALAATDWTTWREGGWPEIARMVGGATFGGPLAFWIAAAALLSACAMFNSLLLTYSRIPLALAQDGLLPRALAVTAPDGTPRRAVITAAICYSVVAVLPFAQLVVADVVLYAAALFLEFAALLQLRVRDPYWRGGFRVPTGTFGVALLAALPLMVLTFVVLIGVREGELGGQALLAAGAAIALGPMLYGLAQAAWRR